MPLSIPVSDIVRVTPSVVSGGGASLGLNGLFLTTSPRVPIGTVLSFPSEPEVAAFFGIGSQEDLYATKYFGGFDGSNIKPNTLWFMQYNTASVAAYLRGGQVSALTLTQLQALTGVLIVTIDGVLKTSSAINLSGATSFGNAAQLINAALGATGPAGGSFTASIAAAAGGTMTVTSAPTAPIQVGDVLSGTGVTAGTYVTAFGTGAGGTGTYLVSNNTVVASTTITNTRPAVSFDTLAGAFVVTSGSTGASSTMSIGSGSIAAGLGLTTATGGVLSQGALATTPAAAMAQAITQTQNWATFTTAFEPITADKIAFALWTNGQGNRYAYIGWDTDITVTQPNPTASFGYAVEQANYSGTCLVYQPSDLLTGPFISGAIASIDFTQTNGRTTLAFRGQTGMTPGVTSEAVAKQLLANGYNFYGAYATATQQFNFLYNGSVSGPFDWLDSFVNQIWLNTSLQQAVITLMTQLKSIPYNNQGYGLLRQGCMDPINAALKFGAIRPNVPLSAAQAAEVNAAAGTPIDTVLSTLGWYLQILPATAQVRAARGSPPMALWYMDGGSVQAIAIASVLVQ